MRCYYCFTPAAIYSFVSENDIPKRKEGLYRRALPAFLLIHKLYCLKGVAIPLIAVDYAALFVAVEREGNVAACVGSRPKIGLHKKV